MSVCGYYLCVIACNFMYVTLCVCVSLCDSVSDLKCVYLYVSDCVCGWSGAICGFSGCLASLTHGRMTCSETMDEELTRSTEKFLQLSCFIDQGCPSLFQITTLLLRYNINFINIYININASVSGCIDNVLDCRKNVL